MKEKFPRKCDATGIGMHEGYVVCDGLLHFSEQKHVVDWLRNREDADNGLSDEFLLEEAYALDEYYYTEWDIDDCEYWYEYGTHGHLVLVNQQESKLQDIFVLYDEDRDKLYQWENGVVIVYYQYDRAYYWEKVLNEDEDIDCNYEAMQATHLPDHQIDRLYKQLTKNEDTSIRI